MDEINHVPVINLIDVSFDLNELGKLLENMTKRLCIRILKMFLHVFIFNENITDSDINEKMIPAIVPESKRVE